MKIGRLREIMRPLIGALKDDCTHSALPDLCRKPGMPIPDEASSKRDRMYASFDALQDEDVPNTAERLIARGHLRSETRGSIIGGQ